MSSVPTPPTYGMFLQTLCVADSPAMDQYMEKFTFFVERNNQNPGNAIIGLNKDLNYRAAEASATRLQRLLKNVDKIITPDAIDYVESMEGTPKVQYFGAFEAIGRFPQTVGPATVSVIYEIKDRPFKTTPLGSLQISKTVGLLFITVSR